MYIDNSMDGQVNGYVDRWMDKSITVQESRNLNDALRGVGILTPGEKKKSSSNIAGYCTHEPDNRPRAADQGGIEWGRGGVKRDTSVSMRSARVSSPESC